MASAGIRVDESIPCGSSGPGDALDRLLAAVNAGGDYQAVRVAPDRLQFARTYRPTWATVVGILTIWMALIGILFLLVKKTETCLAVIDTDHRGTRIRLKGKLTSATLGRIRSALGEGPAPMNLNEVAVGQPVPAAVTSAQLASSPAPLPLIDPVQPAAAQAPPPMLNLAQAAAVPPVEAAAPVSLPPAPTVGTPGTHEPSSWIDAAVGVQDPDVTIMPPRNRRVHAATVSLVLDDGRRFALAERNLVGRDPAGAPEGGAVQLVAVEDPTRSVSKTHLALEWNDGSWLVTDRHSTNGVALVSTDGSKQQVPPGVPTHVPPGTSVVFGERQLWIVTEHA